MLVNISEMINEIYGYGKDINYPFLRKKIIEKMGERDISRRSLRNFLQTLMSFEILEKQDEGKYSWKKKLAVNVRIACHMLIFYGKEYLGSPQINLDEINDNILLYFDMPTLDTIARKYNGILWDYSIRFKRKVIILIDDK